MVPARTLEEVEEAIRVKLLETEEPMHVIAAATSISKTHLIYFKNHQRNLSFRNLQILADYFRVKYILKN